MGSNPIQVAIFFLSIAFLLGRTNAFVAQLVEQRTENPRVVGSIPTGGTSGIDRYADLAHLVERDLAKVEVAGSSPVIRSKFCWSVAPKREKQESPSRFLRTVLLFVFFMP